MFDFLLPLLLQGIVLPLSMLLDMLLCVLLYRSFCGRMKQQHTIEMLDRANDMLHAKLEDCYADPLRERIAGLQEANDFLHGELVRMYIERPQGEWLRVLAIAPSGPSNN
jgi:hypothetical protein